MTELASDSPLVSSTIKTLTAGTSISSRMANSS